MVLVLRRTSTVWPAAIVPGDIFCRKRALTGITQFLFVRNNVFKILRQEFIDLHHAPLAAFRTSVDINTGQSEHRGFDFQML